MSEERPVPQNSERIRNLQHALNDLGFQAVLIEPGPAMLYFTGVRWGRSERTFVTLITRNGDPAFVLPAFEEGRARELIPAGAEVYVWQEDESPFARVAEVLTRRGISAGRLGVEDGVRFFIFDGLRRQMPKLDYSSAAAALKAAGAPE
jgi:Xaa-Pro dipeptidase